MSLCSSTTHGLHLGFRYILCQWKNGLGTVRVFCMQQFAGNTTIIISLIIISKIIINKQVSNKRYTLSCAPIEDSVSLDIHAVWSEYLMHALWVAMGPMFLQDKNLDCSDFADMQTDLILHCTHIQTFTLCRRPAKIITRASRLLQIPLRWTGQQYKIKKIVRILILWIAIKTTLAG